MRRSVELQVEPHYRIRRIQRNRERLLRHRKYRENIMVWMIVRRRARTAVTRLSEVRPRLKRCRRELASERITGVERQFRRGDWDVDDEPAPKAAAGRRVRIVAEAFRSAWRAGPHQMRRLIASRATEAEVFREYMSFGKVVSVAKALAASLTDIDSVPLRKAPPARGHFRTSCWRNAIFAFSLRVPGLKKSTR